MAWVKLEGTETGGQWVDPRLTTYDYFYDDQPGAVSRESELILPPGERRTFRLFCTSRLWIEISDDVANEIGEMPIFWRRLGLGRQRKDGTVPLEPPADKIWIQSSQGDAVLVMIDPIGAATFFLLGPLSYAARMTALRSHQTQTVFFYGTNALPRLSCRAEERAAAQQRAWGGEIASTEAGPP